MITNTALDLVAKLLGGRIVEAGWGTSGTAPSRSDTSLTDPTYSDVQPTVTYPGNGQIQVTCFLQGTSTTKTLQEIGLFGRDDANQRILLARRVRSPVTMDESVVVKDTWTITVEDL